MLAGLAPRLTNATEISPQKGAQHVGKRRTSSRGRGRVHGRALRIGDIAVALIITCIGSYCVFPSFRFMLGHLWNNGGFLVPHSVSVDDLPPSEAARQLKALTVLDHDDAPDYDRDQFGHAWADEDHNGCDTRKDRKSVV